MAPAFIFQLVAILIAPTLIVADRTVAWAFAGVLAAASLVAIALSARISDYHFAVRVTPWIKIAVLFPIIWAALQILPIPLGAHSIWINTAEALGEQSWGRMSVDVGMTIEAIVSYAASISLIACGLFVLKDRRRAELTLLTLAILVLATTIISMAFALGDAVAETDGALPAFASLGVIFWLALAIRIIEGFKADENDRLPFQMSRAVGLITCGVGLVICVVGLATSASLNVAATTLFGAATFGSIQAVRRVGHARWTAAMAFVSLTAAGGMFVASRYDATRALSPLLQFATTAPADSLSATQRMLADTGWAGTGAGTYEALVPIYQELEAAIANPPTTIAAMVIELGWPIALLGCVTALGLFALLYSSALFRGRDSFYPAAAAACVIAALCQAFCDASLLNPGVALIVAIVTGLGLAQSRGRGGSSNDPRLNDTQA